MINVWWPFMRGRWDHGLLVATLEGPDNDRLWPIPMQFNESVIDPPPLEEGAIVVAAGTQLITSDRSEEVLEKVKHCPWALFCLFSDENRSYNAAQIQCPRLKVWQQYRASTSHGHHVLIGWAIDTRPYLRDLPRIPLAERRLRWVFAGQANHWSRKQLVAQLAQMEDGECHVSPVFGGGLSREDYFRLMAEAAIMPCPSGPNSPDSFRLYETLEAGGLPICESQARLWTTGCHWTFMLGDPPPFPVVQSWDELPALMELYQDDVVLQRAANKAGAWWMAYKRQFALNLVDDICELSQAALPEPDPPVTVLISTSPISLHPSTGLIEDTIRRVRAYPELKNAEIIIMVDGVRKEQLHYAAAYEEYKRRLIELCNWHPDFKGCLPLIFDEFTHQANMTREALELVRTPYIFFVEHDTYPLGGIPWAAFFEAMRAEEVNVIQLAIFGFTRPERERLYGERKTIAGVPLTRTIEWSQRPHLAFTQWYRWMINKYFRITWRTMIEDVVHQPTWKAGFEFDVWEYTPDVADRVRSGHNDGRGDDPKYPMELNYVPGM